MSKYGYFEVFMMVPSIVDSRLYSSMFSNIDDECLWHDILDKIQIS